jgi:hypothetical protein
MHRSSAGSLVNGNDPLALAGMLSVSIMVVDDSETKVQGAGKTERHFVESVGESSDFFGLPFFLGCMCFFFR